MGSVRICERPQFAKAHNNLAGTLVLQNCLDDAIEHYRQAVALEPNFAEAEMLYIDPVECIDCGACVPVCPVSAIFALDDLPEKWAHFTPKNAEYYGR